MATEAVTQLRQIIADQLRWSTLDSSELADELVDMIASTRADLAVKVLLETGALEQMSTWHEVTTPGHECWHSGGDYCRQADVGRMIPLYRLADEGTSGA
jgi:hypothetical protein